MSERQAPIKHLVPETNACRVRPNLVRNIAYIATSLVILTACSAEPSHAEHSRTVLLVPIGPVSADLLEYLRHGVSLQIHRRVEIGREVAPPAAAFDAERGQYRGDTLLKHLEAFDHGTSERVVGVLDADAYAPGLNFIYGQARKPGRFAVIALPRLRESFRGRTDDPVRFRERAVKVMVHELGHNYGFPHCSTVTCVMHFANAIGEIDRQQEHFCSEEQLPK